MQTRETKFRHTGATSRSPVLQRACDCGQHTIAGGECDECRKKKMGLQRSSDGSAGRRTAPPLVYDVLRSPGQPLDAATRAFFEPRFGHDFSQVRVHADQKAADSAMSVNAYAYTVGNDLVFGTAQYSPYTTPGRALIAHELAHVVQQTGTTVGAGKLMVQPPQTDGE